MYYNNIYFHNVDLMKKDEDGNYLLCRFDEDVLFEDSSKKRKKSSRKTVSNKETFLNENEPNDNENKVLNVENADENAFDGGEDAQVINLSNESEAKLTKQVENATEVEPCEGAQNEPTLNEEEQPQSDKTETSEQVKESVLDPFKAFSDLSLGVELRFKLVADVVKIKLKLLGGQDPAFIEVYFGNYFAGKNYSKIISADNVLEYTFEKSLIPAPSKTLVKGFQNNIVRILLPTRNVLFCGVEGQTEIPQVYEMPSKTLVFLGSNGLGASEVDKPSFSIAFETASKLNADYYILSTPLNKKAFKKLLPFINDFGKNCVVISDLIVNEFNDKNYRLQLRLLKRKIKLLSKLKKRALFIDYLFNYFNFKREKRSIKVKAKIAKLLKKKTYLSPFKSYGETMRVGINELPAIATGKIAIDLTQIIKEDYVNFNKKVKIPNNYVYYSIKSASDEPTDEPIVMTRKEKATYLKELKQQLKLAKKKKK